MINEIMISDGNIKKKPHVPSKRADSFFLVHFDQTLQTYILL